MTRFSILIGCAFAFCVCPPDADAGPPSVTEDLVRAARSGYADAVREKLTVGADLDAQDVQGETALGWATFNGHAGIVRMLLESGANPNVKNHYGNTPLIYAAAKGHTEILEMLIDSGAESAVAGRSNLTPLVLAARDGHSETVRALLKTDRVSDPGRTVAIRAAKRRGHKGVVELLLGLVTGN